MSEFRSHSSAGPLAWWTLSIALLFSSSAFALESSCPALPVHDPTAAEAAYKNANYPLAASLYMQSLQEKPDDVLLNAGLIQTLLHEDRLADGAERVNAALQRDPQSAVLLTALAEVHFRQGLPWLAKQNLDSAGAIDNCYARAHLIRSRIYRLDSMYASERSELDTAYQIDPSDPDIWHAWLQIVRPAKEIEGISESLKTTPNLDADTREKAVASAKAMRLLLTENSQTCENVALTAPISLPLIASYASVKEISGYKVRVDLPKSSVRLVMDTAASGLYISRAAADTNGFVHDDADPPGTVRAASLHVGPLELRNCMVGVKDGPFADGGEGFIGTDVFASYMITLNFPQARLELAPLAERPGDAAIGLPGDRSGALVKEGFTPVFHRRQLLLLPVTLNKTERHLFVIDTGVRLTTMTSVAAHAASNTHINFTNTLKTVSGGSLQVYRDAFDFQFADLTLDGQRQIIEFDSSALNESAGFEVTGLLGFNILQKLSMQMDYRDGLVKFVSTTPGQTSMNIAANAGVPTPGNAPGQPEDCNRYKDQDVDSSIDSKLQATVVGGFDSSRLKPGKPVTIRVMRDWISPVCTLTPKSNLYGHVVSSTSSKTTGPSTLSLIFDHGDCSGHPKQELVLRLIGAAGGDPKFNALHNELPTEVRGGGRSITVTAASQGAQEDENLAPELAPAVVHPGIVSGLPRLKLTPEGGSQCSALFTSEERSVRLEAGTELIMTMQQASAPTANP